MALPSNKQTPKVTFNEIISTIQQLNEYARRITRGRQCHQNHTLDITTVTWTTEGPPPATVIVLVSVITWHWRTDLHDVPEWWKHGPVVKTTAFSSPEALKAVRMTARLLFWQPSKPPVTIRQSCGRLFSASVDNNGRLHTRLQVNISLGAPPINQVVHRAKLEYTTALRSTQISLNMHGVETNYIPIILIIRFFYNIRPTQHHK